MLTLEQADDFAARWYAAWNADDLDAIMACYDDAIEHSSPFIAKFNGAGSDGNGPDGTSQAWLRGIAAVRDYFGRALQRNPTPRGVTRFNPMHVAAGHESVILVYRRMSGELACEAFFLNKQGKIIRSISHYG